MMLTKSIIFLGFCICFAGQIWAQQIKTGNIDDIFSTFAAAACICVEESECLGTPTSKVCPAKEVCCPNNDVKSAGGTSTGTTGTTGTTGSTVSGCGNRNIQGLGTSIPETENQSRFGEFPWMVAVLMQSGSYQCGGSLIHPRVVLTSANKVKQLTFSQLKVRAGEWNPSDTTEWIPHQEKNVVKIKMHKNFDENILENDIALLVLEGNGFDLGQSINTICLPPQSTSFAGKRCLASGWGQTVGGRNQIFSSILKKIPLPIVAQQQCQQNLRNHQRLGASFNLASSFICAGGEEGLDMCTGDGGSPLVCQISDSDARYYQSGLVSWGLDCGVADMPGVYTSLAQFRSWIDGEMVAEGLDSSQYTA